MRTSRGSILVALLALTAVACEREVPDNGGGGAGVTPSFQQCLAQVQPNCVVSEMDTAAKIEQPCRDLTFIRIPLAGGGSYGPKTIEGGPYGGKIEWNQGAGTPYMANYGVVEETLEGVCLAGGIDTFGEPKVVTDELKNLRGLDWRLFTIFRPACMKEGETYPVITWANGTCGQTHGYSGLLATLASHGFVVIAPNSTWTAAAQSGNRKPVQVAALDYAEALNADPSSIFYRKLDMTRVGAMGHSQGAAATGPTAKDPRVKAVIFWNTGTSNDKPFLNISGERDIGNAASSAIKNATERATQPGAWVYFKQVLNTGGTSTGHLTLMEQPERVLDLTVAWWKWRLNGDQSAKTMFVGNNCGLCNSPDEYEYGRNDRLQ